MSTVPNNYLKESITWEGTKDPECPYSAKINQDKCLVRLNDFPAESLYTLIVNDKEVEDFEDWPEHWIRTGDAQGQEVDQTEKVIMGISRKPQRDLAARQEGTRVVESELAEMIRGIIAGDTRAEEEMVLRYRAGILLIIRGIVPNQEAVEDISQETFRLTLKKVRRGDVRDSERFPGFICGVARNLALEHIRGMQRRISERNAAAEQISSSVQNQFEQLLRTERADVIREVINELRLERDRELLSRYYIGEQDKEQICAELGLTSGQFTRVLLRALNRYKELFLARNRTG